jgi:hypothetical protein
LLDDAALIELIYILSQIGFTKSPATKRLDGAIAISQQYQFCPATLAKIYAIGMGGIVAIGIEAANHSYGGSIRVNLW